MLEPDDLRRAVRMYGGRARHRRTAECPLYPPPPALASFRAATAPDGYGIDVEIGYPPAPRPVVRQEFTRPPGTLVQVAHAPGACPADAASLFASPAFERGSPSWSDTESFTLAPLSEGAQCVAARLIDPLGRSGPAGAATVESSAEPAPAGA